MMRVVSPVDGPVDVIVRPSAPLSGTVWARTDLAVVAAILGLPRRMAGRGPFDVLVRRGSTTWLQERHPDRGSARRRADELVEHLGRLGVTSVPRKGNGAT